MGRPIGSKNKTRKPCKKCGSFDRSYAGTCRICKQTYDREYRKRESLVLKDGKKIEYQTNKDRYKSRAMNNHFKATYGLTSQQVQDMKDQQKGLCVLCETRPAKSVDHCHKTGKVRGVLCRQCNTGIGQLNDDPKLLQKAVRYLS